MLTWPDVREHWRPAATMLTAYLASVLVLHPFGDVFYGADDWAYGFSVKTLVTQGKLLASPWVAAAAVPQTFWAAMFVRDGAVHPRPLNVATICFSSFGLIALYLLVRRLHVRATDAAWVGAFVGVGPLYLAFASSFMSDCYYAVFASASLLGYVSAIRSRSTGWAFAGGAMAALGFLTRQIGICLPAALVTTMALGVYLRRDLLRDAVRISIAGSAPPLLAFGAYQAFPDWLGGRTVAQNIATDPARVGARLLDVATTLTSLHLALLYVVILLLPLFAAFAVRSRQKLVEALRRRTLVAVAGFVAGMAFVYRALHEPQQPLVVKGFSFEVPGEFLHTRRSAAPLAFADATWWVLSLLASLAFPILCAVLVDSGLSAFLAFRGAMSGGTDGKVAEEAETALPMALVSSSLAFHLALTSSFLVLYNNYFLPLEIMGAVLIAFAMRPRDGQPIGPTIALFAATGAVTLIVLDSHFRYVEADERALNRLVASGVDSRDVFGYPSPFAWAHYADVAEHIERSHGIMGVFPYFRRRAHYRIQNASEPAPKGRWRHIGSEDYDTLLGRKRLEIWSCPSRKC